MTCKCKDKKCIRNFLCKSKILKCKLGYLNDKSPYGYKKKNPDEQKYCYNFNGSFHKALQHDDCTGILQNGQDFRQLVYSIENNNQKCLEKLDLAECSELKLADPLASLSSVLVGMDQCAFDMPHPPTLCSKAAACEMIELYSMVLCRDVPFTEYCDGGTIDNVLEYMNEECVLKNLPDFDYLKMNPLNIFRGNSDDECYGPYISQLLLLNVKMGSSKIEQKYSVPPNREDALNNNLTIEWGTNYKDMIKIENGKLSELPVGPTHGQLEQKYIYSGRSLGEIVHTDPVIQFYYNASLILKSLGAPVNKSFVKSDVYDTFVTNDGLASMVCGISEVAQLALKHAWYWKWQVFRRLRPEVFSLWVDNVKSGRMSNDKFHIDDVLLNSAVLDDIKTYNSVWPNSDCSYTQAQMYIEGSPTHPSYPAGHATVAGACATILKMFYDGDVLWKDLPNLSDKSIVPVGVTEIAEANSDGSLLQEYSNNKSDKCKITVAGEINKLASNIAFGRNWAGVHYRTDGAQGILLGEKIAMAYMADAMSTSVHNKPNGDYPIIKFRKFDGSIGVVEPTICKKKE